MRGDGRVFRRSKSGPWWIAYYGPGKDGSIVEVRESTDTTDREQAGKILRDRIIAVRAEDKGADPFVVPSRRITVSTLLDDAKEDLAGKAYKRTAESLSKNLRRLLGNRRAASVTWQTIKRYEQDRLAEKAAKATIDKETALLVRAFRLGRESRKVSRVPTRENLLAANENARKQTIDAATLSKLFDAIRDEDPDFADWCEWFSVCGMRPRETSTLEWADHSESNGGSETLTVRAENAKIRETRVVPIVGPLAPIIERRKKQRRLDCQLVFHSNGRTFENRVGGLPGVFLRIWHDACAKVGLPMAPLADPKRKTRRVSTFSPYLLRHHAARALRSAGVPESVAIAIMGQKTASMFRRYAIVDVTDAADAFLTVGPYIERQRRKGAKVATGNFGNTDKTRTSGAHS